MYAALCDWAITSLLLSSNGHGGLVFSLASDTKVAGGETNVLGSPMPVTGRELGASGA